MAHSIVLVNGMPGAGKTTLAVPLAATMGVALIGKDSIKEAFAGIVGTPLPTVRLGALASETMWSLAGMIDGLVVVESFWAVGRDESFLEAGLRIAEAERVVEVWCDVPIAVARDRFLTRPRHFAHQDGARLNEWESMAARARPCSGQPTLDVETSGPVDVAALAEAIRSLLETDAALLPEPV